MSSPFRSTLALRPALSDIITTAPTSPQLTALADALQRFRTDAPEISIVIPAYNEERLLFRTLTSIARQQTQCPVELIVANNNSTDGTQRLLDACGVRSVLIRQQGVGYARQAGLEAARGRYVANADADCWYPPTWADTLTEPLRDPAITCTYGRHIFLPEVGDSELALRLYAWFSDRAALRRQRNREFVNVLGMNFAFRRADALAVGGFNVEAGHRGNVSAKDAGGAGRCEDGWMALSLGQLGRLHGIWSDEARVWTSDRRLRADGSLQRAFLNRVRRELTQRVRL